jgi:phosphate uptake regulator/aminoglycoside phosphotransferase
MATRAAIDADFRFLVQAVLKQIERARRIVNDPAKRPRERMGQADDYIDLLKSRIESLCFTGLRDASPADPDTVNWIKAINVVTANLERIADFAVNLTRQTERLVDASCLRQYDYEPLFQQIIEAVQWIVEAIMSRDSTLAFRICRADMAIDRLYQQLFDKVLEALGGGALARDQVTALFIFHYLERMGDALLNIGEAILSVVLGERLKIRQYAALRGSMDSEASELPELADLGFESIWGTRSGCRLGRVWGKAEGGSPGRAIFKGGDPEKLLREKECIDRWATLVPGLPPKVLHVTRDGDEASLILEYLSGQTFQAIVLGEDKPVWDEALSHLQQTLLRVWESTRKAGPVNAGFCGQLVGRLDDVLRLHPQFRTSPKAIGGLSIPSFGELLDRVRAIEAALNAPFTVLVHGDLNLDNILYDATVRQLHLIDLHRSADSDYVQDVSVFLASNFRLPVFERPLRERIDATNVRFFRFARDFARRQSDTTFESRLALAMGRSFLTSTRFELNGGFARSMQLRAVHLLEKLVAHAAKPWPGFRFPESILAY